MEIELLRRFFAPTYTIGRMSINGTFFCDTLEDPCRDKNKNGVFDGDEKKIFGETAIPYGRYMVMVTYSPAFKRRLPLLLAVPHFEGVRVHRGNFPKDTQGCPLVGENKIKGQLINSTKYEIELTRLIEEAEARGESVYITIK